MGHPASSPELASCNHRLLPPRSRLIRVRRIYLSRGRLGKESSRQRSLNCSERCWGMMEVEKVVHIVGRSRIGKAEAAEAKDTFDRLHDAAKIVFQVADVPHLGRVG